jgi:ADP-heptose:LPS heptosyltransferase
MENKNLLILGEQGFGDAIQFARFLPMVKERSGARIQLVCWPPLGRLFENTWSGQFEIMHKLPAPSEYDCYTPLMSLPYLFQTIPETIPLPPYLKVNEKDRERWAAKVSALKGKKIGLAWKGSPLHKEDHQRSIDFKHLKRLLRLSNCSFVSLQKENTPSKEEIAGLENFHDWSEELHDFADTAALISCLDLVISVDTAVAHLSGALGQKTWTLLPFHSEWRWMQNTNQSPWYPSMRLIQQKHAGGWSGEIAQIANELKIYGRP